MTMAQITRGNLINFARVLEVEAAEMRKERDTYRGHLLSQEVIAAATMLRQLAAKLK